MIDLIASSLKFCCHTAVAVVRHLCIDLIYFVHVELVTRVGRLWGVVDGTARDPQKISLYG